MGTDQLDHDDAQLEAGHTAHMKAISSPEAQERLARMRDEFDRNREIERIVCAEMMNELKGLFAQAGIEVELIESEGGTNIFNIGKFEVDIIVVANAEKSRYYYEAMLRKDNKPGDVQYLGDTAQEALQRFETFLAAVDDTTSVAEARELFFN